MIHEVGNCYNKIKEKKLLQWKWIFVKVTVALLEWIA